MTPVFVKAQFNLGTNLFDMTIGPKEFALTPDQFHEVIEGLREARAKADIHDMSVSIETPNGAFSMNLPSIQIVRVLEYLETVMGGYRNYFGYT